MLNKPVLSPPTILIVEDDTASREILVNALSHEYNVLATATGQECLGIVESMEEKPDLILMDVILPDINGYDILKQLKHMEATTHIPLLFITAKDKAEDEEEGLRLGALDYITKPYQINLLKGRVKNHMDMSRYRRILEEMAHFDALTEVPNRRYLQDSLNREWLRALRYSEPMSFAMIDIDHFKNYNDHYGHRQGDQVLSEVAACIRDCLNRPADVLARYGGEEFSVLLPNTPLAGFKQLCQKMIEQLTLLNIPHEFSPVAAHVTISIGGCTIVPDRDKNGHLTDDSIIELADKHLYEAKGKGRHTIVCREYSNL